MKMMKQLALGGEGRRTKKSVLTNTTSSGLRESQIKALGNEKDYQAHLVELKRLADRALQS